MLNFKQYYEKKTGTGRQFPSTKAKKGKGKGTEVEAKSRNQEVVIFIGIMKWSEEYLKLKPMRGKRLALKVCKEDPYKVLCEKALEKWKAYNPELYSENQTYVLLLDSGKEAIFLPGPTKEFFSLGRYQEEIGKDFKRITMYLCTSDDFLHSERAESPMENEDSDSAQEFNIQPKRLKEDCFNCDVVDWDLTEFEDTADLINNDEAFAIELQRQLQGESSSQNSFQTSVTHNLLDQTVSITNDTSDSNQLEGTSGISTPHDYSTITDVVQALEKSVNKEKQFFITVRRRTPLPRVLNLWRYEAKKQGVHHELRIKFLEEDGIDSGALTREFFTDVVPAIGDMIFPNGTPVDSTHHVQNGNFRTSGEIVASSLANGGPPPCFMDEKAFQSLIHLEMNALDMSIYIEIQF